MKTTNSPRPVSDGETETIVFLAESDRESPMQDRITADEAVERGLPGNVSIMDFTVLAEPEPIRKRA